MKTLATFIVRHSKRILIVTAILSITSIAMLFRMEFNADVASFILEGNETGEAFAQLQDRYETADPITVVATVGGETSFRDPQTAAALANLVADFDRVEGTKSVASILPPIHPLTGEPLTAEAIAAIPQALLGTLIDQSPVADVLVSEDGKSTMLFINAEGDSVAVARAVKDVTAPPNIELTFAGNPVIFGQVIDIMSWFLLAVPPLVILLMLFVFYLNIGDRRLSALAIFPAIVGSLWTFGLVFGLGRAVDVITVIVPIFVIVMGSADGLHFITHFQEKAAETSDKAEMVESALRHVGIPMILTTISTAVGFLSLTLTGVKPMQDLGIFAATGITFAGVVSLFSLPAMLSRLSITPKHRSAIMGPGVVRFLQRAIQKRWPAPALVGGILVFVGIFLPRLSVDPDQLFFFKSEDPVRQAFATTEELFGGATPLFGEFRYSPGDDLAEIGALQQSLKDLPGIRDVFSVASLTSQLPPEQIQAILSGEAQLPFGEMVTDEGLRFIVFPSQFDSDELQGWREFADAEDGITVLTGMPIVWDEVARLVVRSQVVSLAAALVLVSAMLALAYRRVRETIIALVPIILTVLTLLAFLAASDIQLNLMTAVLSSIVIGVGIDYSIHLIAAIDLERDNGPGYAIRGIGSAGRPIAANALGIAVAMSALWLSPLAIHAQVSMIMWVSMLVGAAAALLVIPALLDRSAVTATP